MLRDNQCLYPAGGVALLFGIQFGILTAIMFAFLFSITIRISFTNFVPYIITRLIAVALRALFRTLLNAQCGFEKSYNP